MGNDVSISSSASQDQFMREFNTSYDFLTEVNDKRFGDIYVYRHTQEKKYISKRGHMCNSAEAYAEYMKLCQRRQAIKQKNILQLLHFQEANEDNICGDFNKITIYFEYYFHDLQKELHRRKDNGAEFFNESELWYLLDSLVTACSFFEKHKIFHGDLRPANILLTQEGQVKIADHGIFHMDQSAYFKMLSRGEKCYIAPSLLRSLKAGEFKPYHDPWKSDVYSLGMTILEAASLCPSMCAYDFNSYIIQQPIVEDILESCRSRYSDFFVNVLRDMLQEEENVRPSFENLRAFLQPLNSSQQQSQMGNNNASTTTQVILNHPIPLQQSVIYVQSPQQQQQQQSHLASHQLSQQKSQQQQSQMHQSSAQQLQPVVLFQQNGAAPMTSTLPTLVTQFQATQTGFQPQPQEALPLTPKGGQQMLQLQSQQQSQQQPLLPQVALPPQVNLPSFRGPVVSIVQHQLLPNNESSMQIQSTQSMQNYQYGQQFQLQRDSPDRLGRIAKVNFQNVPLTAQQQVQLSHQQSNQQQNTEDEILKKANSNHQKQGLSNALQITGNKHGDSVASSKMDGPSQQQQNVLIESSGSIINSSSHQQQLQQQQQQLQQQQLQQYQHPATQMVPQQLQSHPSSQHSSIAMQQQQQQQSQFIRNPILSNQSSTQQQQYPLPAWNNNSAQMQMSGNSAQVPQLVQPGVVAANGMQIDQFHQQQLQQQQQIYLQQMQQLQQLQQLQQSQNTAAGQQQHQGQQQPQVQNQQQQLSQGVQPQYYQAPQFVVSQPVNIVPANTANNGFVVQNGPLLQQQQQQFNPNAGLFVQHAAVPLGQQQLLYNQQQVLPISPLK